ncbi:hypothetical protein TNCV_2295581 [Trichonephila clavipes]|nr:hypothetical protein TNCV_2295581 [Trichonephila clavipes]
MALGGSLPQINLGVQVPLWHGGTLNSHRAATPLVRLVEGEESWEASDNLRMFSLKIGVELSQIVSSPV